MDPYAALYAAIRNTDYPNDQLKALIDSDPDILEQASLVTIPNTCLHVAALAGSFSSVKEIINRKQDWVNRLNKDGLGAIHIAAGKGNAEIVKLLLEKDAEQHKLRSSDGKIALHLAVITGSEDVLTELVMTRWPECVPDLSDEDESVLQFALRNNQVEGFEKLLKMLKEKMTVEGLRDFLNLRDLDGNTVLHIATERGQLQVLKLLLHQNGNADLYQVEVNATNRNGFTALDMCYNSAQSPNNKVLKLLEEAGARRSQDPNISSPNSTRSAFQIQPASVGRGMHVWLRSRKLLNTLLEEASSQGICRLWSTMIEEVESSPDHTRNSLMVVAVLIATITYQAVLSPPGGFKQTPDHDYDESNLLKRAFIKRHSNGMAVIGSDLGMFIAVTVFGSIGFFSSVLIIFILTSRFPLRVLLWLAVLAVCADFICSLLYIAPLPFIVGYGVACFLFSAVAVQLVCLLLSVLNRWRKPGTARRGQNGNASV